MNISILQMVCSPVLFPHTVLLDRFSFHCSESAGYLEKLIENSILVFFFFSFRSGGGADGEGERES